jgi:hypothetical protein
LSSTKQEGGLCCPTILHFTIFIDSCEKISNSGKLLRWKTVFEKICVRLCCTAAKHASWEKWSVSCTSARKGSLLGTNLLSNTMMHDICRASQKKSKVSWSQFQRRLILILDGVHSTNGLHKTVTRQTTSSYSSKRVTEIIISQKGI